MARQSRQYIKKGYYHIFLKGHVDRRLFILPSDYDEYLRILQLKIKQFKGYIIGYTLMKDCINLLIEETVPETISSMIHGTSVLYTKYYHKKYDLTGPVFSGRFKSEAIHLHRDLLCRIRHIHQKPTLQSGLSLYYHYSSFKDYMQPNRPSFLSRHTIYNLFNKKDYIKAANVFKSIHYTTEDVSYFDHKDDLYARVDVAKHILKEELNHYEMDYEYLQKSSSQRDHLILRLHQQSDLNNQEIADLLSISRHVVGRIIRYYEPR